MRHKYNKKYFDVINTEAKAYFLGLLYADGCNVQNPNTGEISITLQEKDRDILEKLKQEIESDYPLLIYKPKSNKHQTHIVFYVYGRYIANSLERQGCVKQKNI